MILIRKAKIAFFCQNDKNWLKNQPSFSRCDNAAECIASQQPLISSELYVTFVTVGIAFCLNFFLLCMTRDKTRNDDLPCSTIMANFVSE